MLYAFLLPKLAKTFNEAEETILAKNGHTVLHTIFVYNKNETCNSPSQNMQKIRSASPETSLKLQ